MRQSHLLPAAVTALLLSACGPGQLVVTAENEVQDPISGTSVNRPLANLEVSLLPYDRDQVFDSLAAAAATPEPAIPQDLLDAQNRIAAAQQEWRDVENRWGVLRDTLQKLNNTLNSLNRASAQYRLLFQESDALDRQYRQVENEVTRAFNRYDELRRANEARSQEIRLQREEWGDEAFAGAGEIFQLKVRESGLDMVMDTTDAAGAVVFEAKPGQYWVFARFDLAFTELYWNVPVTIARGEPVQLQLNRGNANERPRL
jgi:hypothetical protein